MLHCVNCLGFLKDYKMVVHCVTEDNVGGKILLETRDMCRTEEWAFNDYKEPRCLHTREQMASSSSTRWGRE